jgi:type I restriction enzyme S subunit
VKDELPQRWATAPLASLAKARMGETILAKQLTPTGVPVYSAGHANEPWGFLQQPKKPLGKGTVVVSARGSIGFPKIPKAERFASTQTTIALRFPDEEFSQFVCQWLKTVDWTALTKGGAIPMLTVGDINELVVPLPPFAEQRRIVAKLEKLLGKVDACQQRLVRIPVLLKRFRQSVLAAACSGRLTADWRQDNANQTAASLLNEISERRKKLWVAQRNAKGLTAKVVDYQEPAQPSDEFEFDVPESWGRCSMDALTNVITSGSRDWKQYYRDDGSGTFIMAQNIRPLRFDRSYRLAVAPPKNDRDRARSEVFKDDLLVTIVGANTGDCCRVPEKLCEHYVCQSVALIRPVFPTTARFLEIFLNSTGHGLAEWRKWIYGEGRPHLSFDNLRETLVCLPPLTEQQEIVRLVEALFALADQIEARFMQARAQVDKLTPSLLARAFRGELVPQDPNDEAASVLLERIKQQREQPRLKKSSKRQQAHVAGA